MREDSKVVATDTTCVTSIHRIPQHEKEQSTCYFCDVQYVKRYTIRNIYLHSCACRLPRSSPQTQQCVRHHSTQYYHSRGNNPHTISVMLRTANVTLTET